MTSTRTRKPRPLRSLLAAGFVPAVALLGPLLVAPAAHANPTDDAFIAALHAHNPEHSHPRPRSRPGIWSATS